MSLLAAGFFHYLFAISMSLIAVFLILLVLVQRGRGGGLAGAFGGLGGQSAFGAKAGDLFTRITMVAAFLWIVLCMAAIRVLNAPSSRCGGGPAGVSSGAPAEQDEAAPAEQGSSDSSSGGAPSGGTDTPAPSDQ
jgi:preprotein translocase subunit SecG